MMVRNSIRILMSNFSKVWKALLYDFLVFILLGCLTTVTLLPIITELSLAGFFTDILTFIQNSLFNFSIMNVGVGVFDLFNEFFSVILSLTSALQIRFYVGGGLLAVLGVFLLGLKDLPLTEEFNKFMSSNSKIGFMNFYISKFGKNVLVELEKLIIKIPFYTGMLVGTYYILNMFTWGAPLNILAPVLLIIFYVVALALKNTLISGWLPAMAVRDCGVAKGFKYGFKAMSRRFFRTLSSMIMLNLITIIINLIIFLLTGGAGLIISLPMSYCLVLIFNCVMYYGSMGMRYYVDLDTVLSPKRLEEQDTFNHQKNLI